MKTKLALIALAALCSTWAQPVRADSSMMQMPGMGGGRRTSINLVSPASSPVQIGRGMVMLSAARAGMGGMMGSSGTTTSQLRVVLMVASAANVGGAVSSQGNHLVLEGRLTALDGSSTPVSLDQSFALVNGFGLLTARVDLPQVDGRATLLLDKLELRDAEKVLFAAPGVQVTLPTAAPTPVATPGGSCHTDADCDDGDPTTNDQCMPMGCRHMPGQGGGPGMMH